MRYQSVTGLLVAAALAVSGCSSEPTPSSRAPEASESSSTPSTPSAPAVADEQRAKTKNDTKKKKTTPSPARTPSASPSASPGESSTPNESPALEMPPAETSPTQQPLSELIEPSSSAPLVTAPLPATSGAKGRLVAQFPTFLRPTRRSDVVTSSLSNASPRLQVALVARTSLGPEAVLRTYRRRLSARGMREQDAPPTVGGAEAAAFIRDSSSLLVTVRREGGLTAYQIYGVLHAPQR